jgi:hypothetical protein
MSQVDTLPPQIDEVFKMNTNSLPSDSLPPPPVCVHEPPKCGCGLMCPQKQTLRDNSPNKGKWFYGCPRWSPEGGGCGLFKWVTEWEEECEAKKNGTYVPPKRTSNPQYKRKRVTPPPPQYEVDFNLDEESLRRMANGKSIRVNLRPQGPITVPFEVEEMTPSPAYLVCSVSSEGTPTWWKIPSSEMDQQLQANLYCLEQGSEDTKEDRDQWRKAIFKMLRGNYQDYKLKGSPEFDNSFITRYFFVDERPN